MILFILYVILMIVFFKHDPAGVTKSYEGLSIFLTLLGGTILILLGFLSSQTEPFFEWSDLSFSHRNRIHGALGLPRPISVSLFSFMEIFIRISFALFFHI